MTLVADHPQRLQALDPAQSIICEAPAGSGKTELLTQRYLTLLALVDRPEEILAMTFTRKAAGEMRDRILKALQNAQTSAEPTSDHERFTWQLARKALEKNIQRDWNILESPGRLQIKTFDSLCAGLANTLPLHSSFASPPRVSEEPERLYVSAIQTFIATLEDDVEWNDSLARVLSMLDNNVAKLETLFLRMLVKREAWLPLIGRAVNEQLAISILEENLADIRVGTIERLRQSIPDECHAPLVEFVSFAASQLESLQLDSEIRQCLNFNIEGGGALPDATPLGVDRWLAIAHMLLTAGSEWRSRLDKRVGFPAGEGKEEKAKFKEKKEACLALIETLKATPDVLALLNDLRHLPSEQYDSEQKKLLLDVVRLLPILSAYLTVEFQAKGEVDFTEISLRARLALGNLDSPSELALAMDNKLQHILVDEFQDTSPAQIDLLEKLTQGWEANDGRSLFCVGDAMQSIYGFRDANVSLFLQCLESGLGSIPLLPIRLSTNFRSETSVVEWVNNTFAYAFPKKNDIGVGAVSYSPSSAFNPVNQPSNISIEGFNEEVSLGDEAEHLVAQVKRSLAEDPNGSIGILVRNRKHVAHITPLLNKEKLPYRAVDIDPLSDIEVVQDLVSLTHALLRPADRIAWLSILRAPWCGLELSDLHAVANFEAKDGRPLVVLDQIKGVLEHNGDSSFTSVMADATEVPEAPAQNDLFAEPPSVNQGSGLSENGCTRLKRTYSVLRAAIENGYRKSLRQWVEGVWVALGGPSCLNEENELSQTEHFFDLLARLDDKSVLSRRDALTTAVAKLFSVQEGGGESQIHIMTIHKSKGLEFDTVIVPSLEKSARAPDPELLRWHNYLNASGQQALLLAPITQTGKEKDPVEAHLLWQQKKRELNESCRLLYVACTRARKRLHLLARISEDKKKAGVLKAPSSSSLIASIWGVVKNQINMLPFESGTAENEAVGYDASIRRLADAWVYPELPKGELLGQYVPFYQHDNAQSYEFTWQDTTARHVGSCVHKILAGESLASLQKWTNVGSEERERVKSLLKDLGVSASEINDAESQVHAILKAVAEDNDRCWIFSDEFNERHVEFAMSLPDRLSGVRQVVADLVICDGENTWVIDYKTAEPEEGQSQEAFFDAEKKLYRDIMRQYKGALAKMGYKNITQVLYFPKIAGWIEYEQ